ncbi:hypothetical protein C8J57DRAFT_1495107 [Mycena rebaudengoi]|nr:hypothetical protein C8J57DRAFT_1559045 [Mycena rebaudengoi]KAJ7288844.1 hypothetical protein C8J57DRAFT_1495107 [Mycena rebaudengoi]
MSDMHIFRNKLIQDSLYLGTTAIRDKVIWRRIGRKTCLVTKASATAHDAAQPTDSTESQTQTTDDASGSTLPDPITPLIPATLTMIALISPEIFWPVEDGYWKETKGNDKQGVLNPKEKPTTSIKLHHVLFEKIDHDQNDGKLTPPPLRNSSEGKFKIADWPVNSIQAREALADMTSTHRVTQLPTAYDIAGKLIQPGQYKKTLMGAVVRASFALRHWNIASEEEGVVGHDSYAADIDSIRVIVAAPPFLTPSSSPRKRKIMSTDPGSDLSLSGSKKPVAEVCSYPVSTSTQ